MLWTDYFKPPHFEKYPQLNELFNEATKLAGAAGTKGSADVAKADELLAKIDEIRQDLLGDQAGLSSVRPSQPGLPAAVSRQSGLFVELVPGGLFMRELAGHGRPAAARRVCPRSARAVSLPAGTASSGAG